MSQSKVELLLENVNPEGNALPEKLWLNSEVKKDKPRKCVSGSERERELSWFCCARLVC